MSLMLIEPTQWMETASCQSDDVDPDMFFSNDKLTQTEAKMICRLCPVIDDCKEYAIPEEDLVGIWGGMTEEQRIKARRQRRGRR